MKANIRKAIENKKIDMAVLCCYYTAVLFHHYDEVTFEALKHHAESKGINIEEV